MTRRRTLAALACAALLTLLTACGVGDDEDPGAETTRRPSSTAVLTIVEPTGEAGVPPGPLTVRLGLEGARIMDTATTNLRPDEGHVHLNLDGKLVSMAYGLEQTVDVDPGVHTLEAEFVSGDHAPFDPRITVTRAFLVAAPS